MPKGRGSNERRRSWRQKHPRDNSKAMDSGALKLEKLYERARKVHLRRAGG